MILETFFIKFHPFEFILSWKIFFFMVIILIVNLRDIFLLLKKFAKFQKQGFYYFHNLSYLPLKLCKFV
jgi:hypothetical protein